MQTLTPALLAELGLTVTRPGYLIELGYSTTLRLSTMGAVSWGGNVWAAADVRVSGVGQNGSASNSASLQLGNTDDGFGALILNEGASEIAAKIWVCYAGATGDPVQVFDGVTDGAEIDSNKVTLALMAQGNATLYSPRTFINKASGFNYLQPAGTKIYFGGETFILER